MTWLATRHQLLNKYERHTILCIPDSHPTSVTVVYQETDNSTDPPTEHTRNETYSLTSLGEGEYSFDAAIPADKYTVKPDTEESTKEFEHDYSENEWDQDLPLWVQWPVVRLPYCDTSEIKFEIYNLSGERYEVVGANYRKDYWQRKANTYRTLADGTQRLYSTISMVPSFYRMNDGPWRDFNSTMTDFYIRATGYREALASPLLKRLLLPHGSFEQSSYPAYGSEVHR